jgi:hypothetical protein
MADAKALPRSSHDAPRTHRAAALLVALRADARQAPGSRHGLGGIAQVNIGRAETGTQVR